MDASVSFDSFAFNPHISTALVRAGYQTPTPIQHSAISPILSGRDVMALAQTGTGKTAAFVLPIIQKLAAHRRGVRALIVVPTRELADQVHGVVEQFGGALGIKSAAIYGGVSMFGQLSRLRSGVDVVVACPGRLLDHMQQGSIRLDTVEVVVLDEADRMFDMGFLPNIRKIVAALPKSRQSLMFSATMRREIRDLALGMLRNPEVIQVNQNAPTSTVTHVLYTISPERKEALLFKLLKETSTQSVLIFTRTKHRAKKLAQHLEYAGQSVTCLQGNLSQNRRQEAMQGFRDGRYQILVATDIAARGIDVASVSHVINFDMPDTVEAYTHRIGRTGRAAKEGDAVTFVTREDEFTVRQIERSMNSRIPRQMVAAEDLPHVEAPAPQRQASGQRPRSGGDRNQRRGGGRRQDQGGRRGSGGSHRGGRGGSRRGY